jgi:hypothetical protein
MRRVNREFVRTVAPGVTAHSAALGADLMGCAGKQAADWLLLSLQPAADRQQSDN